MNSCFPHLAILNSRTANKTRDRLGDECNVVNAEDTRMRSRTPTLPEKNDIFQDLDLYYVRQIARNSKEHDLEQKIEVEIKMREGSARLLAAAKHRAQTLEAAKALLTSNERMSVYMAELQTRRRESTKQFSGSTGKLSISDLRIPLMWRDSDHFKNRGDHRRFAVFCLARLGTEIHDTSLLCPIDRAHTDLSFPDVLIFNNVPADFELVLEIYSYVLQEDLSIASTPRRIKKTIHSSISKTVGKKLAASLRDEFGSAKSGPHFDLVARAKLTLDDTDDNTHTHDLVINSVENKYHSLPLFGHFCCRLAVQPECMNKEMCIGNVKVDGQEHWVRLQGSFIKIWESKKHAEEGQNPERTIPINKRTIIYPSKSSGKELLINNSGNSTEKLLSIKFESKEEAQKWSKILLIHINDHSKWKHAAEVIQRVSSIESTRNSFISNKRQGSLYDETPLIESIPDYSSARPTVQTIFDLTPSTSLSSCSSTNSLTSLRSRSLSISGVFKQGAISLKPHLTSTNKKT
ncbi:rhotekin isoform X2 [Monomorium pharaonis]|uniref:rhotekin isoform X2 n=1 Tax=Monomorium pharaonis TaxID=307658 RepID=UPI00063F3540|nr:rhotekin isoform X2 [Monomorium pharaonis]